MFKQLKIYYFFISLPFVILLTGATYFFDAIKTTIIRNPHPQINYTIFVIILIGGFIILLNSRRLMREAKAISAYTKATREKADSKTLQEVAELYTGDTSCLLQMLATSGDRAITHQEQAAIEHELTNARTGLIRRNALPQYLTGLLVGMGLLGTFIGLLATLSDISALISSFANIDMNNADPIVVFGNMIERMRAPMQSMSIAFSASMFGLLGSIILGLMMVGIRRLQGDIFSSLSSQVARHIETALSFESISFRNKELVAGGGTSAGAGGEASIKILMRIEERLAESARLRQRALSTEIDDFKKQREEMLLTLKEQTAASNNFRNGLQQLGEVFSSIVNNMEKNNSLISSQISDLTVRLAGDAKETHKFLANLVEEQKALRETVASYNVEERLAEMSRMQQRTFSAEVAEFKTQREDMLRILSAQNDASNNFSSGLQQLDGQLGSIFTSLEKGHGEISHQISELTVHMAAEAKESQLLLSHANNNLRSGLQHLDLMNKLAEKGNAEVCSQISQMMEQLTGEAKESRKLVGNVSNYFRGKLQQIGDQLGGQAAVQEKVPEESCA